MSSKDATSGSIGASEKRRTETGECRGDDGMSYRQGKRMAKRYREGGAKGLQHGSAGRESNRRKPKKFRERVLRLLRSQPSVPARLAPARAAIR